MRNSNVANRSTKQTPSECKHFCHCIDRIAIAEEVVNKIEWHCELQNDCPSYEPKEKKDNGNK